MRPRCGLDFHYYLVNTRFSLPSGGDNSDGSLLPRGEALLSLPLPQQAGQEARPWPSVRVPAKADQEHKRQGARVPEEGLGALHSEPGQASACASAPAQLPLVMVNSALFIIMFLVIMKLFSATSVMGH